MRNSAKTVAFVGVMSALMFVVMFLESYVFTFLIPIAPPCVLSLSLAITLSVFGNWKGMFIGGTIMGVCSLVVAFIIGNPAFILPWISILPRVFIGIVAFAVSSLFINVTKNCKNKFVNSYLPYGLGAMFGVLTNTLLVLSMLYLNSFIGISDVIATFVAINFPLEIVGSMILVPILVNVIKKYVNR
ncbi:MAG: hypothetical protein IKA99_04325 [Clostridia bacterium]|nr:hypothetical protein [Clostridia bacterium]